MMIDHSPLLTVTNPILCHGHVAPSATGFAARDRLHPRRATRQVIHRIRSPGARRTGGAQAVRLADFFLHLGRPIDDVIDSNVIGDMM